MGSRIKGELHRVGVNCYRRRPNEHTCIKIYSISGEFRRCRFVFFVVCAPDTPVLHRPQKKSEKPIFRTNPRLEAHLPPFFLRMTFRNSAITRASPLIKKSTTLRLSRWCSHCSVAERQQFSCPLGTATSSLKLENVVPGFWICFFSYCDQVFFLLFLHR